MHVSGVPLDVNWFLQFIVTAFVVGFGLFHLMKNTVSEYFSVDAIFMDSSASSALDVGLRLKTCAVCGNSSVYRCSGCKLVGYCSGKCQIFHWKSAHRTKCKEFQLSGKSAAMQRGRRYAWDSQDQDAQPLPQEIPTNSWYPSSLHSSPCSSHPTAQSSCSSSSYNVQHPADRPQSPAQVSPFEALGIFTCGVSQEQDAQPLPQEIPTNSCFNWKAEHTTKCKDFQLSGKGNACKSAAMQCGRRYACGSQQQDAQPLPQEIPTNPWYPSSLHSSPSSSHPTAPSCCSLSSYNVQHPADRPQSPTQQDAQPLPQEIPTHSCIDELRKLLDDKDAYRQFFLSLDQVKIQNNLRDELRKETLQLARENLENEQQIMELQNQCKIIRTTELAAAQEKLHKLEKRKEETLKYYSPASIMHRLQEESEALHRQLLDGEIEVGPFLQKYKKLRNTYHRRALTHEASNIKPYLTE